ncbi:MAG: RagB/SusD family nutrient uptake outer membrane protein [Prevotella sp.]|nr:RagB/SusD family nutrient uptake outer membrane protein [Prevotella sp.]
MKKILYSTLFAAATLMLGVSCSDYLETDTLSKADAGFVFSTNETARAALEGAYSSWTDAAQNKVFGDGLFYAADVAGSDIERHPENFSNQPGRHYPECFYQNGAYASEYTLLSYQKENDTYASLYAVINKACIVVKAISESTGFQEMIDAGVECTMGQLYGEAVALKATAYRELIKYFGDVPYISGNATDHDGLVGRDSIYDVILAELQQAAPVMYRVGSIPGISGKNYFSRTYVEGLIGRIALEAGGYQTRRGDIARVDGKGNALTFENMGTENNGATYGRRSDWQDYYRMAQTYFKAVIDNPGSAKFITTDSRTPANPYQVFFQQMHAEDETYADESIYEYAITQGGGNDARPYSFGRPTTGGSKNNYPCKNYGQGRINPAFYYGVFDPADMRRDVSCTVTATKGADGTEIILPFTPGSQGKGGGIAYNKWDENRQDKPWVANQRKSGINGPYMRMSEIYLGYAEACAALGETSPARQYLDIIRNRAFGSAAAAKTDAFIAKEGSLLNAIIQERGFEFAGEGDRRWTLIRTGLIGPKIKEIKELTEKMFAGLKANGSYTFDNGNTISEYIWTKYVDLGKGKRLVNQCPDENDPAQFPGWRGVNNDWSAYGLTLPDNYAPNLAIKGLFTKLTDAEIAALEADGYKKTNWAVDLVKAEDEYNKYLFLDYDYVKAPIYLWPFTPNVLANGGFKNGYGFKNE